MESKKQSNQGHIPVAAEEVTCVTRLSTVMFTNQEFHCDEKGYIHVYTDGACGSNGKAGAKAGIGVWFGLDHPMYKQNKKT